MEEREGYLHITSKMSFRDRNVVYFKAHFQTMLVKELFLKFWALSFV